MADGAAYRAVFLRMHPTGKAVLSLSEASQGKEATLAGIVGGSSAFLPRTSRSCTRIRPLRGGKQLQPEPSDAVGENVALTARKLRDKAQIVAGSMLDASPDSLSFDNGHWGAGGRFPRGSGSRR